MIRAALLGSALGALVGLLVVFVGIVNGLTGPRVGAPAAAAVGEEPAARLDSETVLRRIAAVQARAGDFNAAQATVGLIPVDSNPDAQDLARNAIIEDYLFQKVRREGGNDEVLANALKMAESIGNPLIKANALQQVAAQQERFDAAAAKKTLAQANQLAQGAPWVSGRPPLFQVWLVLWPVGLAVFGFLFVLVGKPFWSQCCGTPAG
jgi:hypothetical protein